MVIHGDLIHSPPAELHAMVAPWLFVAWGIDVIGPIEPKASNGHRFILVDIDYFTKWVEAVTFKSVTKKVAVDFVHANIISEIDDDEWVKTRLEHLSLIEKKRLTSVCHGQLYQRRMARAYNKKVRPRNFEVGQLVLKRIFPHQVKAKGKFSPNWQGPFVVKKVLPNGALYLTDIKGKMAEIAINADAVKIYYV
ncbi:hypothetical protein BC332_15073 [Capsicum chinense]|nr:hypothetical protein BC332_15073 [Capsicum chinense]